MLFPCRWAVGRAADGHVKRPEVDVTKCIHYRDEPSAAVVVEICYVRSLYDYEFTHLIVDVIGAK